MVKKEEIQPGLKLTVNKTGYRTFDFWRPELQVFPPGQFYPNSEVLISPGTTITCLSKIKSYPAFSGKIVDIEINNNKYQAYWMELRIQTNKI